MQERPFDRSQTCALVWYAGLFRVAKRSTRVAEMLSAPEEETDPLSRNRHRERRPWDRHGDVRCLWLNAGLYLYPTFGCSRRAASVYDWAEGSEIVWLLE